MCALKLLIGMGISVKVIQYDLFELYYNHKLYLYKYLNI